MSDKKNPRDIAEDILSGSFPGILLPSADKDLLVVKIKDAIKIERVRQRLLDGKIDHLNVKIKTLQNEAERLRTALEFYACDFNWHDLDEDPCTEYQCVHTDKGHVARVTLDEPMMDLEKK